MKLDIKKVLLIAVIGFLVYMLVRWLVTKSKEKKVINETGPKPVSNIIKMYPDKPAPVAPNPAVTPDNVTTGKRVTAVGNDGGVLYLFDANTEPKMDASNKVHVLTRGSTVGFTTGRVLTFNGFPFLEVTRSSPLNSPLGKFLVSKALVTISQ